ncbi:MAG: hypothetical protein F2796_07070, partial [Actinobacteria bacterium]|nr:hypothetical protein [Actinomycetota bacterium]
MTALLALSLSAQIEKYGAYAGIAAIAGIGVLALLFVAQARELRRLREWAGRQPERDLEQQQRVAVEAQRRVLAVRPQPTLAGGPAGPPTPPQQRPPGVPGPPAPA